MTEENQQERAADAPLEQSAAKNAEEPIQATQPPGERAETSSSPTASAPAATAETASDAQERIAELERQLAEEREHATDYMHRLQRAQADFANYKRRAQQEQEQRDLLTTARVLGTTLPALDSFERAFLALPPTLRYLSWIDGIALVHLQLREALRVQGIEPVSAEPGQPFDPQRHESVGEVESADQPEGSIAVVLQQGYAAKGLLLRPALVQLARKPQAEATQPEQSAASADANDANAETEAAADQPSDDAS